MSKILLLTGMFDMVNFGDLLFPLIARHRLSPFGWSVVPVAPTASQPPLEDAMPPIAVADLFSMTTKLDAIAIGGGYVIHNHPLRFIETYDIGDAGNWAGSALWMGACLAATLRNVPLVWNAPGAPHPLAKGPQALARRALRMSDYVSLRDQGSAEILGLSSDKDINIVPDTVAGLADMWPRADLAKDFRSLQERKAFPSNTRLMALHLRRRSVAGVDLDHLAKDLDAFAAAHELTPVLVAVGQSHDDATLARDFSRHIKSAHILLDDPTGLREIAAVFAYSTLYVGASLHGYIASAAYGVPGILVARPAYRKFSGFLEHTGRINDMVRDWGAAWLLAGSALSGRGLTSFPESMLAKIDSHWARLRQAIEMPPSNPDERHGLLTLWMQQGLSEGGPAWALRPLLPASERTEKRLIELASRKQLSCTVQRTWKGD
jgi:polysaccharide pyruvyl transferase WcaK-like protein